MAERALMLVLHDVAPETWPDYRPFVEAVDALGTVPITWLVVPDFHRRNPLQAHPWFCQLLDTRLARGDELVLHGYCHADEAPPPRTPRDWFMRRIYTHEGEFYALEEAEARRRLAQGMQLFAQHGWPLHGFVAPAWLMSAGTRRALRDSGLTYTSDPRQFYLLPDYAPIEAPGLVWSARNAWRRGLSRVFCEHQLRQRRESALLRLGLHPVDMRHEFSRRYWLELLQRLLKEGRQPVSKIEWLRQYLSSSRAA
ncbi:polysaccharide deacetylase family protein [Stutzerimonas stutzeri]|uniref:polysaccharide deacetylase family protein n=1 Tax=Stutzerimonas sp. S1 TaxID=3030652 RepID=UPI00222417E4|nr:polysaccharide deacetylase family protein [Stutzerimonas sp. S1]MCW3149099.1 polysaccharide deacetylase family protein [Stutzerimonas sp. S1]